MTKTMPRIRGPTPTASSAAKELQCHPTPAERVLWEAIKGRQLNGLRFRQQHAVGPVVLDFSCPSCKLAIDVDGGIHDEQVEQDEYRDQHLAAYGYCVLRVRNDEVLRSLPAVLGRIAAAAIEELTTASHRPPVLDREDPPNARDLVPPQDWVPASGVGGAERRNSAPDRSTNR